MKPSRLRLFARLPGRLRTWGLPLAVSLGTLGCSASEPWLARGVSDVPPPKKAPEPIAAPEALPAPVKAHDAGHMHSKRFVPVTLDAIFHLAEGQNAQVNQAREKLNETYSDKYLADKSWIPEVNLGVGYNRHEGGILTPRGRFVHSSFGSVWLPGLDVCAKFDVRELTYQKIKAEQSVWQQEGEVSRLKSDTLVEAASAYIDLLAARESEAIGLRLEQLERNVLEYAEKLVKADKTMEWLVESARAALKGRQTAVVGARQQGDAAAARLAYLLGMSPDCMPVPAEGTLRPFEMVDAHKPTEVLVSQALATGPSVRETEAMLAVIQRGIDASKGAGRFLPTVELNMIEGNWGGGPGSNLRFDNRWDMCLGFRWNLSGLCTAKEKLNKALSQQAQAEFGYIDLKGRLTLGVQESQQVILSARTQLTLSGEHIKHARESHRVSDIRMRQLRDPEKPAMSSPLEVLNSIRGIEAAEYNALSALRAHNKAQVRLLILLGINGNGDPHNGGAACEVAPPAHH